MDKKTFIALLALGGFALIYFGNSFAKSGLKKHDFGTAPVLRFRPNHEFIILHITDLHYGESEEKDSKNDVIHEKLISMVKPDVVVNTGDAVSGYAWDKKEQGWYKRQWQRMTEVYRKLKVPYAYALGNHDIEADATLDQIGQLERGHEFSLFDGKRDIDPTSISNFMVHVYSSFAGAYDKIAALLWIFDSKKSCKDRNSGNGCINKAQLDWYEEMSHKHQADDGHLIQGMSFFHVPIQEFMHVWNYEKTFGIKDEDVSCPHYNTGVFQRFYDTGNMRVVACGHDHNNNYGGRLNGIDLIFGQKTGYGSYGPTKTPRGARVFKLKERLGKGGRIEWDYETYIIFEDGSVVPSEEPVWQGHHMFQDRCDQDSVAHRGAKNE